VKLSKALLLALLVVRVVVWGWFVLATYGSIRNHRWVVAAVCALFVLGFTASIVHTLRRGGIWTPVRDDESI
jgi:hypothetical protein